MKIICSIIIFFFFFSAVAVCEASFQPNFYHKDCLSIEHCLFSASSSSDKNSAPKLPIPVSHCHSSTFCAHSYIKSEIPKSLIRTNTPILVIYSEYLIPEYNLEKSIFNPPRPIISVV